MDLGPVLTVAGTVLVAIITTIGTVYLNRAKTKQEFGAAVTTGFRELTDQLQQERAELSGIIAGLRAELAESRKYGGDQDEKLRRLLRHLDLLEKIMETKGLQPPVRPGL